MADTSKSKPSELVSIAAELQELAERAQTLVQRLRAVRGTGIPVEKQQRIIRQPIDPELYNRVRKMLETEPMRLMQICEVTGLHENKIKAVITKMQREDVPVVNLGAANKALWFIPSPKVSKRLEHATSED